MQSAGQGEQNPIGFATPCSVPRGKGRGDRRAWRLGSLFFLAGRPHGAHWEGGDCAGCLTWVPIALNARRAIRAANTPASPFLTPPLPVILARLSWPGVTNQSCDVLAATER